MKYIIFLLVILLCSSTVFAQDLNGDDETPGHIGTLESTGNEFELVDIIIDIPVRAFSDDDTGEYYDDLYPNMTDFDLVGDIQIADSLETDVAELRYDLNGKTLDKSMQFLLNNKVINVTIKKDDLDDHSFGIDVTNKIISTTDVPVSPTFKVLLSETTYLQIRESDDQMGAALTAYKSKEITVEALGFLNTFKLVIGKVLLLFI